MIIHSIKLVEEYGEQRNHSTKTDHLDVANGNEHEDKTMKSH